MPFEARADGAVKGTTVLRGTPRPLSGVMRDRGRSGCGYRLSRLSPYSFCPSPPQKAAALERLARPLRHGRGN
jgi:hypothetical protein